MNPNQALWEKGDFTRIAASMRDGGEELVNRLGITKGLKVLDLGCGDGTTALPARGSGPTYWASTSRANLVEAGNRRAKEDGPREPGSSEGDASDLNELKDDLRSRREHLRSNVRSTAVRRRQGDGARDVARRSDRHGELDSGDPTLVAQILKISSRRTHRRLPKASSAR